jgi:hypothetical protein
VTRDPTQTAKIVVKRVRETQAVRLSSKAEKVPSICKYGAEDGIRTRDPHLGKVVISVCAVASSPPPCRSVHPVSTPSIESGPVVERSATSRRTEA